MVQRIGQLVLIVSHDISFMIILQMCDTPKNISNSGLSECVSEASLARPIKRLKLEDGTAALPSLAFDDDTGLFSSADNTVDITCGGTAQVTVDASETLIDNTLVLDTQAGAAQIWFKNEGGSNSSSIRNEDNLGVTGRVGTAADMTLQMSSGGAYLNLEPQTAVRVSATGGTANTALQIYGSDGTNYEDSFDFSTHTVGGEAIGRQCIRCEGNPGNPSYAFIGDGNSGMYRESADTIAFSTAGAKRLTVDGTETRLEKKLAIATNNPQIELDNPAGNASGSIKVEDNGSVVGRAGGVDLTIQASTGGAYMNLETNSSQGVRVSSNASTNDSKLQIWGTDGTNYDQAFDLSTANVSSNSVGRLCVSCEGNPAFPSYAFLGNFNMGMYRESADTLAFSTANTKRLTIDSGGVEFENGGSSLNHYFTSSYAAHSVLQADGVSEFFTSPQDINIAYHRIGQHVTISWETVTGTSAAATVMRLLNVVPAAYRPTSDDFFTLLSGEDNGSDTTLMASILTNGDFYFYNQLKAASFTSGNTCSVDGGSISYIL